jgi:hypothetical protein
MWERRGLASTPTGIDKLTHTCASIHQEQLQQNGQPRFGAHAAKRLYIL